MSVCALSSENVDFSFGFKPQPHPSQPHESGTVPGTVVLRMGHEV